VDSDNGWEEMKMQKTIMDTKRRRDKAVGKREVLEEDNLPLARVGAEETSREVDQKWRP
jgi:hypothetical protein